MKTPKPKPPASQPRRIWRLLERGEIIQKGDQVLGRYLYVWMPCSEKRVVRDMNVRRRILVCGYREIGKGRGE